MKKGLHILLIACCIISITGCSTNKKENDSGMLPTPTTKVTKDVNEVDNSQDNRNSDIDDNLVNEDNTVGEDKKKDEVISYEPVTGDILLVAKEFAGDLIDENFDKLIQAYQYDDAMRDAMATDETKKVVIFNNSEYGTMLEIKDAYSMTYGVYQYVYVPVKCFLLSYNLQLVFDNKRNIVGFSYTEYEVKDGTDHSKMPQHVIETEYSFESDGYRIDGTLTIPTATDNTLFPIVILVHGSGPSDRNESIYENKPFRDIAWALAEQGIASYRYDKRTFTYNDEVAQDQSFTINDEVVGDVISAAIKVKEFEIIDPTKVYILGHSLGGYMIPKIAESLTDAAGFILMASPSTPMQDYIVSQYEFLADEDGSVSKEEQKQINLLKNQVALLSNPSEIPDGKVVLGAYKEYWMDLAQYDAINSAKQINAPVLVLQGERDYQVTMDQFNIWKDTFDNSDLWSFKTYPSLNHLMMPGSGNPSSAEYKNKSTVDTQVLTDIIEFINE